jgi:hypothetical protein
VFAKSAKVCGKLVKFSLKLNIRTSSRAGSARLELLWALVWFVGLSLSSAWVRAKFKWAELKQGKLVPAQTHLHSYLQAWDTPKTTKTTMMSRTTTKNTRKYKYKKTKTLKIYIYILFLYLELY